VVWAASGAGVGLYLLAFSARKAHPLKNRRVARFSRSSISPTKIKPAGAPLLAGFEKWGCYNVWGGRMQIEKLRYIHRNPVRRGLVESPEQLHWSSFRAYAVDMWATRQRCETPDYAPAHRFSRFSL
jgi:hypothetical protein